MLEIVRFVVGPLSTNAYLIAEEGQKEAVAIDPGWDGELLLAKAAERGWRITNIWLTHAHFDHFGGAAALADGSNPPPPVALHPADYPLWRAQGGAAMFGMRIDPGPEPTIDLTDGQTLYVGSTQVFVRYAPGHTPGHVVFYVPDEKICFCGDVIFRAGIGRTDLAGGSYEQLMESIHSQILTLPGDTRLLSGHGGETTVDRERRSNPFLV
jgi:glyoxylase-like metal-dependent hydrolase (beta-lactamase superfamily II)